MNRLALNSFKVGVLLCAITAVATSSTSSVAVTKHTRNVRPARPNYLAFSGTLSKTSTRTLSSATAQTTQATSALAAKTVSTEKSTGLRLTSKDSFGFSTGSAFFVNHAPLCSDRTYTCNQCIFSLRPQDSLKISNYAERRASPLHVIPPEQGEVISLMLSSGVSSGMVSPLEFITSIAFLPFWPYVEYVFDLAALSFVLFVARSIFIPQEGDLDSVTNGNEIKDEDEKMSTTLDSETPNTVQSTPQFHFMDPADNPIKDSDSITPQKYASSESAELKVESKILKSASMAFSSTDFSHEPHLSPELEATETAYEAAVLANAAHALADAAEKENRQSMAALEEREREMDWIECHGDGLDDGDSGSVYGAPGMSGASSTRVERGSEECYLWDAILEKKESAKTANLENAKVEAAEVKDTSAQTDWVESEVLAASMGGQEHSCVNVASAAASSVLLAEHALAELEADLDDQSEMSEDVDDAVTYEGNSAKPMEAEWMESEVVAASMGGQEHSYVNLASAAASSVLLAEHALAEIKEEEDDVTKLNERVVVKDVTESKDIDSAVDGAASRLAETAERMILGEDIAYLEQAEKEYDDTAPDVTGRQNGLSETDRWRKDYMEEIKNYVQQKGIEETKSKMSRLQSGEANAEKAIPNRSASRSIRDNVPPMTIEQAAASQETSSDTRENELVVKLDPKSNSAIQRALENGLVRRTRRQRGLIIAAVLVVLSRRLVLAWVGNASRLFW